MAYIDRDSTTESLSREISDAAQELANRISFGEFDDLDEGPLMDLRSLSDMMEYWATVAQALEERLSLSRGTQPGLGDTSPPAFHS